ncbi:MAG: 50S ribosomal protein L18e [Candidatus Korarchaeota archaeon]|nr:50S ribosomal protein L18e [Candidatus Korarchaeota archaeon]
MRRTGPTNILVRRMIRALIKASNTHGAPIWRAVAEELERPRRRRVAVNLSRINRYTEPGDTVVVPGKVLGAGGLDHPVTIAALAFSEKALEKIRLAGGKPLSIFELVESNPRGSRVKIMV